MNIALNLLTPASALLGGVLIGVAVALLVLVNGRVAGISGIVAGLLQPVRGEWQRNLAFVLGLLLAPIAYRQFAELPQIVIDADWSVLILAGLLVGIGTRYASGCTSGHGVCGLSRFSLRSLLATVTFMAAGFLTVFVTRHLLGAM